MPDALTISPIQFRDSRGRIMKGNKPFSTGTKGVFKNPLKGKKMPEEWRLKLCKPKSATHPCSEDTKKKIGAASRLRTGPLNGRWKGGSSIPKNRRRRERLASNGGSHTNGEWETLKARVNWSCVNPDCKKPEPVIKLTKDHIVSLVDGGSDNIENIQPLCMRCNVKKRSKSIRYV